MRTNLRVLRVSHNLTQGEMAKKLGCSAITLSHIENGSRTGGMRFWENLQKTYNIPDSAMWELTKNYEK